MLQFLKRFICVALVVLISACGNESTTEFKLINDSSEQLRLLTYTTSETGNVVESESLVDSGYELIFLSDREGVSELTTQGSKTAHFNILGDRLDSIKIENELGLETTLNLFSESVWEYHSDDKDEMDAELNLVIEDEDF